MAEFQEVMKILKRQYESMGLYDFDYAKMEQDALKWAAEHPEPVYPTWVEWLIREGIIPEKNNGMLATAHDPDTKEIVAARIDITPSALRPIPADTAEKLGLKPKEAE